MNFGAVAGVKYALFTLFCGYKMLVGWYVYAIRSSKKRRVVPARK